MIFTATGCDLMLKTQSAQFGDWHLSLPSRGHFLIQIPVQDTVKEPDVFFLVHTLISRPCSPKHNNKLAYCLKSFSHQLCAVLKISPPTRTHTSLILAQVTPRPQNEITAALEKEWNWPRDRDNTWQWLMRFWYGFKYGLGYKINYQLHTLHNSRGRWGGRKDRG